MATRILQVFLLLTALTSCKGLNGRDARVAAADGPGRVETAYDHLMAARPKLNLTWNELHFAGTPPRLAASDEPLKLLMAAGNDDVKTLLEADAGVKEKLTINQHTSRVLSVLNDQYPYYRLPTSTFTGREIRAAPLMAWLVAVHDLGKGVAIERGEGAASQHRYVPSAAKTVLTALGFNDSEVKLGTSLVSHDLVGSYVRAGDEAKLTSLTAELSGYASDIGISMSDYWQCRRLFYTADASSYNAGRGALFGYRGADGVAHPFDKATLSSDQANEVHPAGAELVSLGAAADGTGRLEVISARMTAVTQNALTPESQGVDGATRDSPDHADQPAPAEPASSKPGEAHGKR